MAFTTDLNDPIGELRFWLGDDQDETANDNPTRGILPDGKNLTDDQIAFVYQKEGSVDRALAGLYELLAQRFAQAVTMTSAQRSEELSTIFERYDALGKAQRAQYGGKPSNYAEAIPFRRIDANSVIGGSDYT